LVDKIRRVLRVEYEANYQKVSYSTKMKGGWELLTQNRCQSRRENKE
jgi:hypothetical protein